jgi:hypothetical protein
MRFYSWKICINVDNISKEVNFVKLALPEKQNHLFNLKDIIRKLTNTNKNNNGFFSLVYCGDIYRLNFFIVKFIGNHRDTVDGTNYTRVYQWALFVGIFQRRTELFSFTCWWWQFKFLIIPTKSPTECEFQCADTSCFY